MEKLSDELRCWLMVEKAVASGRRPVRFSFRQVDMGMMLRSQKGSFLANRRTRLKPHRLFPSAIVRGSIHHRRRPDTADSMRGRL